MKFLSSAFALSILFYISAFSQEAVKFDEFVNTTCDNYWARTGYLYTELDNNSGSKAYIFVYQGKLTKPIYDKKGHLKRTDYVSPPKNQAAELIGYFKRDAVVKNIPPDKIVFVEGGFREKFIVELWLVPVGANPPQPTPTLSEIKQRKPIHYPYGYCSEI